MIRVVLVFALIILAVVAILAGAGEMGQVSIVWLGWRADLTASAFVLITTVTALAAMIVWRLLLWLVEAPRRAEHRRTEVRRRQASDVLTRGFLAAAAGDGPESRRLAVKAGELATESPDLVRILAAQAAEANADLEGAKAAYAAMLGFPNMQLAGLRGLMTLAISQGDRAAAARYAEQAYGLTRTARWAWRSLLEARLEAGDWQAGRDLVKSALDRKLVSPIVAERGRAALLAASAAQLETEIDPKAKAQATVFALEAAKLQPGFAPGVVMAARRLLADGKPARAAQALEAAWKVAPHPALWLAYRDLKTNETPRQRADRLNGLAALNPTARESRILVVEAALIGGDLGRAREAGKKLESEPLTARIAGLQARTAFAGGASDEARLWLVRGAGSPSEPDWSDLDPEGNAFAYLPADWARLVVGFAETGALIHPRHERRERGLSELPDLPISYTDQAPFQPSSVGSAPYLVGEGLYGDDDQLDPDPTPQSRPTAARRRLATGRRAAK